MPPPEAQKPWFRLGSVPKWDPKPGLSFGLGHRAAQPVGAFVSTGAVKPWDTNATMPVEPSWMSFFLADCSHAWL
jgi:hypothetical protein